MIRLTGLCDAWRQMFPVVQLAIDILANIFIGLDNPYICRLIQLDSVAVAEVKICNEFLPKPGKEMQES